ncbi:MAG TPA: sulfotransferase domain-containing protein [Vicinamibacterales bacterium]|nr:sulfotransferase domain-containing protein [Vicinamibacterales bacterium]
MPTFLIVGAQKAGTTSLADLLRRHPRIGMASTKEVHYFDRQRDYGLRWYTSRFRRVADRPVRFEATPNYMYAPVALPRMARVLPDTVRFVAILRDPVDRAYSHYWHSRRVGAITVSFEEALRLEPRYLAEGQRAWWSLVDRGRYLRQLQRFTEAMGRDRLLVVLFDDLLRDPAGTADRIAEFVGVEPLGAAWGPLPRSNRARRRVVPAAMMRVLSKLPSIVSNRIRRGLIHVLSVPFTPPPMNPATRAELAAVFRADNDALAEWLGRDLSGWTR